MTSFDEEELCALADAKLDQTELGSTLDLVQVIGYVDHFRLRCRPASFENLLLRSEIIKWNIFKTF